MKGAIIAKKTHTRLLSEQLVFLGGTEEPFFSAQHL